MHQSASSQLAKPISAALCSMPSLLIALCLGVQLEKCPNQPQAEKDMQTFSWQSVFVGLLVIFGSAACACCPFGFAPKRRLLTAANC